MKSKTSFTLSANENYTKQTKTESLDAIRMIRFSSKPSGVLLLKSSYNANREQQ